MAQPDATHPHPAAVDGDSAEVGLSCLVISRTPALLNRMLASLQQARAFWKSGDEVLCSWNGSAETEAELAPPQGLASCFQISQREPYHFATNINQLARRARGRWLLLLNDDLILDPGSVDRALQQLEQHPEVGVLGGLLRTPHGNLGHAGLLFSSEGVPYNRLRPQLGPLLDCSGPEALSSGPIPAVTGALMLLRRADFLAVGGMRESFRVCGEDVVLCLDLWRQLGKPAYYASDVGAVHEEKSTRGTTPDQPDLLAVARLAAPLCREDAAFQALQSPWALQEAELLCQLCHRQWQQSELLRRQLEEQQQQWEANQQHWAAERAALLARIDDLSQRLEALLRSTSWALTRPWRALGRCFSSRGGEPS